MNASAPSSRLRSTVIAVSRVASIIGIVAMGVMVLHITVDVIFRLFDVALPGTVAFVANYYMLFVTFLPLVVVERECSHIEVEVVAQNLPQRIQSLLRLFAWLLGAAVLAFLGWESAHEAVRAYRARMFIIEQSIRFDTWIPYFVLPGGYFLASAVAVSRIALTLLSLRRGVVTAVARAERYFAENTLPQEGRTHD
jgi:TRAP-type C4-dicarboxylate transport system permease small subunit